MITKIIVDKLLEEDGYASDEKKYATMPYCEVPQWYIIKQVLRSVRLIESKVELLLQAKQMDSPLAADIELLSSIIQDGKVIQRQTLIQKTWTVLDTRRFETIIDILVLSKKVERVYEDKDGNIGIWFSWIKDD